MKSVSDRKVANGLKQFRQARGLALYGLAVLAGVSPTMLSAIERWGYQPRPQVCQRIATALGITVGEIWPEEHTRTSEQVGPGGSQA
jgi:DNA-binding XRE family transcriptional regulator